MEELILMETVAGNKQLFFIFIFFIIYSVVVKGIALWKAARKTQKGWFVALLVINTLGILELLYIFIFSKKENKIINNKSEKDEKNEIN
jgi:hypothetical protein